MTKDQDRAIINFFKAVSELQKTGVTRSTRYLGDIGEFLASKVFCDLKLNHQLRESGHDGLMGKHRIQIKFHNSTTRTNIDIGNPENYEILVVVIGPESRLRDPSHRSNEFRLYHYDKKKIKDWNRKGKKYYCAKGALKACDSMKSISMSGKLMCK